MNAFTFRPAKSFSDQHGLFVALVGGTNSGKTFSALRLARGIAGPAGKIAVLDTEGGRTLHLKDQFDFDVMVMGPPHRPHRYLEAAKAAQEAGYACFVIDSFSSEWRGVGGVLDWTDEELEAAVERSRAVSESRGFTFDENRARNANKMAASIRPKMSHKLMVAGFLDLRIPIIFAIRGEMTLDPDTKKEAFKAQCQRNFLFEVTVSFRLAANRKGIVDLSDPASWKMEGAHRNIFADGDELSEEHGANLAAWAGGNPDAAPVSKPSPLPIITAEGKVIGAADAASWQRSWHRAIQTRQQAGDVDGLRRLRDLNASSFPAIALVAPEEVADVVAILDAAILAVPA